jgi:hypothetical protein
MRVLLKQRRDVMEGRQSLLEQRALGRHGVRAWFGAAVALAVVGAAVLAGVAVHEVGYASSHPFAYGPAKVIAVGAGAGALVAVAVAVIGIGLLRDER